MRFWVYFVVFYDKDPSQLETHDLDLPFTICACISWRCIIFQLRILQWLREEPMFRKLPLAHLNVASASCRGLELVMVKLGAAEV